jgi:plastocyanin
MVVFACAALLTVGLLAAARAGTGSASSGEPKGQAVSVTIAGVAFKQSPITVTAGTVVTWVNRDDMPHTVREARKTFASPVLDTGDQFSHRFTEPGTYEYYCSIHPTMTGTVVVTKAR